MHSTFLTTTVSAMKYSSLAENTFGQKKKEKALIYCYFAEKFARLPINLRRLHSTAATPLYVQKINPKDYNGVFDRLSQYHSAYWLLSTWEKIVSSHT